MQGPQWSVTGNLKDSDIRARLGELDLPVLVNLGSLPRELTHLGADA